MGRLFRFTNNHDHEQQTQENVFTLHKLLVRQLGNIANIGFNYSLTSFSLNYIGFSFGECTQKNTERFFTKKKKRFYTNIY